MLGGGEKVFVKKIHIRISSVFIFIMTLLLFVSGCQSNSISSMHEKMKDKQPLKKSLPNEIIDDFIKPIALTEKQFQSVIGFTNDRKVIYIQNNDDTSSDLISYHIQDGETKLLFEGNDPIVNAKISPNGEYVLIHTSPTFDKADLLIMDLKTEEILIEETIPSYELMYEWSPYNHNELMITCFYEDFSYQVYLLDITRKELKELSLSQPFIKWKSERDWIAINWERDNLETEASFIQFFPDGSSTTIHSDRQYYYIDSWNGWIMGLSINKQDVTKTDVIFYNQEFEQVYKYTIPHLNAYSSIAVFHYDLVEAKDTFYYIRPKEGGEVDTYTGSFQLVAVDLKNGEEKIVKEDIPNAPISCNNEGDMCLFGYRFEQILKLNTGDIDPLVTVHE